MPLKDSTQSEQTEREEQSEPTWAPEELRTAQSTKDPASESSEEIVTPIEARAQAQAEREFETEREIPASCKKAIVSVNGQDVDEVPLANHKRAA